MQQFTVPQFIDVEDKIIGPVTVRQFILVLVDAILTAICYKTLDFSAFVFSALLIFLVFGTMAFVKINGRPFHFFALNFLQTKKKSNIRVWNSILSKTGTEVTEEIIEPLQSGPSLPDKVINSSRLAELSLIVDTQGAYKGEMVPERKTQISSLQEQNKLY